MTRSLAPARGGVAGWLLGFLVLAAGAVAASWYFAPNWLPDIFRGTLPPSPKAAPVLYKWRDAKGGLHVTDVAPTDRPYETVRYDPNTNVVPSVMPPGTPPPKHDD